jgi:peptidyl-prolyl cis-trans isomerase A (cyclophilin A)
LHAVKNPYPNPDPPAPDSFHVKWWTTARSATTVAAPIPIVLEVVRKWSPRGVDRFYSLVRDNYYDCAAFFRVVPGA